VTTNPGDSKAVDLAQPGPALSTPVYTDVQAEASVDGWPPCTCPQCTQAAPPQPEQ
jgi:hypothetical protein